jgi:hypothetical protein
VLFGNIFFALNLKQRGRNNNSEISNNLKLKQLKKKEIHAKSGVFNPINVI